MSFTTKKGMEIPRFWRTRKDRYQGYEVDENGNLTLRGRIYNEKTRQLETPLEHDRGVKQQKEALALVVIAKVSDF